MEKVGVFVDYEEGLVSFYDVESRSHIYSFTETDDGCNSGGNEFDLIRCEIFD
ncbi:E3 ubiquitin-protein ligase TRIM39-like [Clarias magur]|uniref:E3 ubiquitin-protein ligase TRIM39-like n=1 Tax=Clarias magur TaxID=1594786 RepID=A0A8J4U193_CLAMG|nr:E3 ubiquitin-protein ligase TRIM39-like [Clarias magur]